MTPELTLDAYLKALEEETINAAAQPETNRITEQGRPAMTALSAPILSPECDFLREFL